jgi:hypothetical protein
MYYKENLDLKPIISIMWKNIYLNIHVLLKIGPKSYPSYFWIGNENVMQFFIKMFVLH